MRIRHQITPKYDRILKADTTTYEYEKYHCEVGPAYSRRDNANRNFWLGDVFIFGPRNAVEEDWWEPYIK